MTRIADADSEAKLLDFARHGTAAHVERMVREWRRIDRCDASLEERAERRGLTVWVGDDGSYEVRGRLCPEVGSLLVKALETAERRMYRSEREAGTEDRTSGCQRRADALGLWLEERVQPHVQIVMNTFQGGAGDEDACRVEGGACQLEGGACQEHAEASCDPLARLVTEEGSRVSAETSSRLACDAEMVRIRQGEDGSVLDLGRRERFVGWRLRKALQARDGGCRFPGCGSHLRNHAHHVVPWSKGGATAMDNLVLLCPFHHRAVHEGGWKVKMDDERVPRFFNPLGVPVPDVPEAPKVNGGRVERGTELVRWHRQEDIGPLTGGSLWEGERIDWGWAMACLKPEGSVPVAGDFQKEVLTL